MLVGLEVLMTKNDNMKLLFSLLFSVCFLTAFAQSKEAEREAHVKAYQENITKSRINGVYIPRDIPDAIKQLKRKADAKALESFSGADEDMVAKKLHFGLGRWMIYNWNFEEGSRLSHNLSHLGLINADEMAQLLIRALHRDLNQLEIKEKEIAEAIIEKRERAKKERFDDHTLEVLSKKKMEKN